MDAEKMMLLTCAEELREQLEAVKHEREALYYDMQLVSIEGVCHACLHNPPEGKTCERSKRMNNCFVWRGPCQANGGKAND